MKRPNQPLLISSLALRDLRDDLFQRPSALSAQASREDRGGLGLLSVKRMLELHGGGIRLVESVSGARFRFFVPL